MTELCEVSKVSSEKKIKFYEGSKAKSPNNITLFLNINYYINNHNIAIFYFIFVIKNKNRCKKKSCRTNIRKKQIGLVHYFFSFYI